MSASVEHGAFDADRTAAALIAIRAQPGRVVALPGLAPDTLAQGLAVQIAVAGRLGVAPAGFKIGATAPQMQAYLGLPGPLAGFMAETGLHGSGSTLAYRSFFHPGVECELAVVLAHDLPAGPCTPKQAAEAVGTVMTGIEVVENRYGPLDALHPPTLLADQVFHAAAVLGAGYPGWDRCDLVALQGHLTVDGAARGSGRGGDLLGGPMSALAWLAASDEAAAFGGLRAGQVVMLGSVIPPVWLDGPARIEVHFPPLPSVVLNLVPA